MEAPSTRESGPPQQPDPLALINAIAGELAVTQHVLRAGLQTLSQAQWRTITETARDTLEAACAKQLSEAKVPEAFLQGVVTAARTFGLQPAG
jgi:hypothetical protein